MLGLRCDHRRRGPLEERPAAPEHDRRRQQQLQPTADAESSPMCSTSSGTVRTRPIQKRRLMSISSGFGPSSALATRGSRAMPHLGQLPGRSRTISGSIGQMYSTLRRERRGRAWHLHRLVSCFGMQVAAWIRREICAHNEGCKSSIFGLHARPRPARSRGPRSCRRPDRSLPERM